MIKVSLPRAPRLNRGPDRVRINRCSVSGAWYADRVGQIVAIEFTDDHGYWAREGGTFNAINWIAIKDATALPFES